MGCLLCDDELEHCHEVLVLHIDGSFDCVNPSCEAVYDEHEFAVSCMEMRWPCDCSRVGHAQPLAA